MRGLKLYMKVRPAAKVHFKKVSALVCKRFVHMMQVLVLVLVSIKVHYLIDK